MKKKILSIIFFSIFFFGNSAYSKNSIELYEKITGEKFIRSAQNEMLNRVEQNVLNWIKTS